MKTLELKKGFTWTGILAVSYTHLDVYKRQLLMSSFHGL